MKYASENGDKLSAVAAILAVGIIRRKLACAGESSRISAESPEAALEHAAETVLSVSTRVNPPESSYTDGDAHEN